MKIRNNQSGFSAIELVIILVIVCVLGFVGYSVYDRQQNNTSDTGSNQQASEQSSTASDVKPAPEINSTSDLDTASDTLEQTDPSGSNNTDAGQLDNELSAF